MKNIFIALTLLAGMIWMAGCKKWIAVDTPVNQLTTDKVFADSTTAESALTGTYALFNTSIDPGINRYAALHTDEMVYTGSDQNTIDFNQSTIAVDNPVNLTAWRYLYQVVYNCNDIISQLTLSALPAKTKTRFSCEAKFLRAYAYFYLVNFYGHIPLLLTTNVNDNMRSLQNDPATVYNQLIADLTEAEEGLAPNYRGPGKVRANKWAAAALLAKAYLFKGDNLNSEAQANLVIGSNTYTPLTLPGTVFSANSQETILSFYTINGSIGDASSLIPGTSATQYPASNNLLSSFEAGDRRKSAWLKPITTNGITSFYPNKYHNQTTNTAAPEYLMAFRAGEVYLIRAAARARQNKIPEATSDLNVIRQRAGLTDLPSTLSQPVCIDAVNRELQTELFMENGDRFLYLKNSGKLNDIMSAAKTTWTSKAALWPIPQKEITYDNRLVQNTGY